MIVMDVLTASGLFSSNSDIHRTVKQNGVKLNGVLVDDVNEQIEPGDFINFAWFQGGTDMMKVHGRTLLLVSKGKRNKALIKVSGESGCELLEFVTDGV